MARNLNKCMFIGRIGKDLELKYIPSGSAVLNSTLACGDDYKDKNTNQKVEKTEWVNFVVFGKKAEIMAQYCKKGSKIFLTGKFTTRRWEDNDGNARYSTEINVDDFEMLDSRGDGGGQQGGQSQGGYQQQQPQQQPQQQAPASGGFDDFDDDIPFMRISDRALYCL